MAGSSIRQLFVSVRDGARRQRSVSVVWVKMASIRSVGSVAHRQLEQLSSIRTFVWEPSRDSASRRLSPVAAAATGGLIGSGIRHTVLPVNLTSSYSQIKNIGSDCGWTAISPLVARPGGQSASVVAWRGFATDQKGGDKEGKGREPAPEMGSAKDAEDRGEVEEAGYGRARENGEKLHDASGAREKTRAAVDLAKDVAKGIKEAAVRVVDVATETVGRAEETAAGVIRGSGSKEHGTGGTGDKGDTRDGRPTEQRQGRGAHDTDGDNQTSETEGSGEEKIEVKCIPEDESGVHVVHDAPGSQRIPMGVDTPEMGSAKDAEDREKDEAAGYERARETGKEVREAPGTKGKTRAAVDLAKDVSKGLKEATAKVVDVAMETAGRARETAAGIFEGAGSNKEGGTDDSGKSSEFRDQQGRGAHDSKTEGAGEMVGEKTQKSSHEDEPGVHGVQGVPGTKSIPMGPGGLSGPEDAVPGSVQSTLSRS
ncbi:hypothetical protein CBR_g8335 [Chara braunii]|uniref:Uncharacterized protein n=1 Tax=Chara braunii TaxID=69332 RepID=A0A388KLV9_CHABU|nr:hypothetical protein CBR_g8335 [Chara braunii]|eukprot:GBG71036.1 hypothetical protein CBR_g8335 [Chara braunii]